MTKKDLLKGLTDEQIAKARECHSEAELLELAEKEGIKLTEDQLASVSGGCGTAPKASSCPDCGSTNVKVVTEDIKSTYIYKGVCLDCGCSWKL